ncbi:MAG: TIGR04063 family PEP-CTERM/XrtA system glycosyltransferase [Planctomycetota bacterium]
MKVLHVLDHSIPLHSGYSFRTRAILTEQRALGIETFHVTSTKHHLPYVPEEEVDGFRFFRTEASGGLLSKLPVLNQWAVVSDLRRRLDALLDEITPDIVHAHSPCLNALAALAPARRRGIPVVYEMRASWEDAAVNHGTCKEGDLRYRVSRALESRALRKVDAVTTICEGLRTEIADRGIPADKVTVIPNAVDADAFPFRRPADESLRSGLGLAGDGIVLGFIGSFYHYEGLHVLLDALPAIARDLPDAKLLLVGGGFEEERLREQAERLGLEDRLRFTGRVPHEKVADYYSLCDVMVYPRLDIRLTRIVTPLKPLEAMAQGRVVVASDIGGHRELIRDGDTGVLFPSEDAAALARAVIDLARDESRWPGLQERGRAFVEAERTWKRSVERYLPLYASLT